MYTQVLQTLDQNLQDNTAILSAYKQAIRQLSETLGQAFTDGTDVRELVHARATFIDELLTRIWHSHMPADCEAALIAVGGYGRGELHPASDVDVLILTADDPQSLAGPLESLVMFLWDIGLEIGHSVRSLDECVREAEQDVTVITNLMECRHLAGLPRLCEQMQERTTVDKIWSSKDFFEAKLKEQQDRHAKANDSGYDLEPNLKTNPGGLRDIQMIGWVAKRHFGATRLSHLKDHRFLTEHEYNTLKTGEHFLWEIRFALHQLTGRHEDRLLFEHQRALAKQFGYTDENTNLAVEQFMQRYYRIVVKLQRLNEMLLQLFEEAMLNKAGDLPTRTINRRFHARGNYIEVTNPAIFARSPLAMLEMFLLLQQHPELKGVRASTIRSIRAHRHLIDRRLRNSISARSLFMEILRQPTGITHELRRMHRYGILARYIPAFYKISGLMQFDLFHSYTVDEHIMMVIRNMRRFFIDKHTDECPLCFRLTRKLPKPELLFLAGLFHDIAKGRGGDHSRLGSQDAIVFCREHDLSEYDSQLVAWLVDSHLIMSSTAQRQDIDDPEVIQTFAERVSTTERLDYLYLLTVADMRGTNPGRWNSWKGALLGRLHQKTTEALKRGLDSPQSEDQLIQKTQQAARELLSVTHCKDQAITDLWMQLSTDYFLQTLSDGIAWHTQTLLQGPKQPSKQHIHMRVDPKRGCSEILTYGPDRDGLLAETTTLLDRMGLNILGARVDSTSGQLSINSYQVLEDDGEAISPVRRQEIINNLSHALNHSKGGSSSYSRRMPRQLKSFVRDSQIDIEQNPQQAVTKLNIVTHDRPGLLSTIGRTLAEQELRLRSARIITEGAIARDSFTLTDRKDEPITEAAAVARLEQALIKALDEES